MLVFKNNFAYVLHRKFLLYFTKLAFLNSFLVLLKHKSWTNFFNVISDHNISSSRWIVDADLIGMVAWKKFRKCLVIILYSHAKSAGNFRLHLCVKNHLPSYQSVVLTYQSKLLFPNFWFSKCFCEKKNNLIKIFSKFFFEYSGHILRCQIVILVLT